MKRIKPELISPAGDWPSLKAAVENGADSVYFGVKGLNMRNLATNFDILEMGKVMDFLRKHKKKGYLALNVVIMNNDLSKVKKILQQAKSVGVDAVVLWDMAVFSLAKELGLRIHISTQASVSNTRALDFWSRLGVKRVNLARECTLSDIKQMLKYVKKEQMPCEIETFIHGAMCVSISGRCFLSYYSQEKSANKGECLQPCRREFIIKEAGEGPEYVLGRDYVLSPKDLCTIDFIDELIKSGINAFKIEGRMRSPEYIKVVTSTYREAIDSFYEGTLNDSLKSQLKDRLSSVYNRGFSSGFYFGKPEGDISRIQEHIYEKVFLGEVKRFYKKINVVEIRVQTGTLKRGDQILFIGKNTPAYVATVEELQCKHTEVQEVNKGESAGVKLPFVVRPKDKVFLWRRRE